MSKLTLTKKYGVYPEYKDSGVEWLGEVPASWNVQKIMTIFEFRNEKVTEKTHKPLSVTYGGVKPQLDTAAKVADGSARKLVCPGDIAINSRSDRKGAVGVSELEGGVSLVYNVLRKRDDGMESKYYHYLFRSKVFGEEFYRWGRGIVDDLWTTRSNEMKRIFVSIPFVDEQKRIANFLDEKINAINSIIEKKQRQIELLKEKRAAVINHAVTKGLNPKAKLVDSGVGWIGTTPNSWELTKIKPTIKTIQAGVWGDEPKNDANDIKCLRVADFDYEYLTTAEPKTVRNNPKLPQVKTLKDGDILFEKSGGGEKTPVGRAVLYSGDGGVTCANFIDVVRVDEQKVVPAYLVFYLAALYDGRLNTKYIKQNTGIQNIKAASYFSEQIPLPPKSEQEEIVQYLQDYLDKDRLATEKLNKTIALLQEFKSSLISHVVTGKIKV